MASLRRLASSSALRGIDIVSQVIATLWITPQLVHTLGKDQYGLWVTVITLVSYLDIFDFGLTSAVTRYISRALGKGDANAVHDTVRSAFTLLLGIGAVCLIFVAILATVASSFLPEIGRGISVAEIIWILGAAAALSFPLRVFAGVLEAHVRYELTTAASITRTVVSTALLSWILHRGDGLLAVVMVVAGSGLFQRALNYFFARRVLPTMRLLPLGISEEPRKQLLSYGVKNFLMKIVDLVRFRIDALIIARFVGVGSVGVYSVGMALIRYYREFIECIGSVFMPVFSRAEGAGSRDAVRGQLSMATRTCACMAMLLGGGLALYGGTFIEWWLGPGFEGSHRVVLILVGPFIIAMAQNPGIYLLYGLSKQERLLRLNVIEAIGNLGLSLVLVFRWGIEGVAAGTAISLLVTKLFLQPTILCEESGMSRWGYYVDLLLRPLLTTAVVMALCHLAIRQWLAPDLWRLAAAGLLQTIAVGLMAWCLLVGPDFRTRVMRALTQRPT